MQKFPNDLFYVYPNKIGNLQLLLGKLFYFFSKVTTFVAYILLVHDKIIIKFHDASTIPTIPSPKSGGRDTPNPLLLTSPAT